MSTTIVTQNFDGVTAPALPTGWSSYGAVATFAQGFNNPPFATSPNSLATNYPITSNSFIRSSSLYWDGNYVGPDQRSQMAIIPYTVDPIYLLLRANSPDPANCVAYAFEWKGGRVAIGTVSPGASGGTFTSLVSVSSAAIDNSTNYLLKASVIGSTLSLSMQRGSDNKWLTGAATYQASETTACVVTDTTIAYGPLLGVGYNTITTNVGTGTAADTFTASYDTVRAGQQWYVSPTGNATNNGTSPATPITLAQANITAFVPGDTISFFGTNVGMFNLPGSGSSGSPITVNNYDGTGTISAGDGDGIRIVNGQYITITGLNFTGSGVIYSSNSPFITTTSTGCGVRVLSTLTVSPQPQSIAISNNTINHCHDHIMVYTPTAGLKTFPTDSAAWGSYPGNTPTVIGYNNITITGNKLAYSVLNSAAVQGGATSAAFGTGFLPLGLTVHSNLTMSGNTIQYCYGTPTASGAACCPIVVSNVTNFSIAGNLITDCGQAAGKTSTAGAPGGIGALVALECTGSCIIQTNVIARVSQGGFTLDGCGIDTDGGAHNVIVQGNLVYQTDGACYQTGTFPGSSANTSNTFRFNVGVGGGKGNLAGCFYSWAGNGWVHHNTFYASGNGGASNFNPCVEHDGGTIAYYNNVMAAQGYDGVSDTLSLRYGGGTANFSGNCYYNFPAAGQSSFRVIDVVTGGGTYTTFAAWKAASGQENGTGVNADPQLRAIASAPFIALPSFGVNNYDVKGGSGILGSGIDVTSGPALTLGALDFRNLATAGLGLNIGAVIGAGAAPYSPTNQIYAANAATKLMMGSL